MEWFFNKGRDKEAMESYKSLLERQFRKWKKKKKNSPRPSFFHQIQDKWSHKLVSQREKFPWQEPEEEQQQQQPQKEEKRDQFQSNKKNSASNFQFPKRFSPWAQVINPTNAKFDSVSDDSEDEEDNDDVKGGSVREERKGMVSEVWNESERVNNEERKKRRSKMELAERCRV